MTSHLEIRIRQHPPHLRSDARRTDLHERGDRGVPHLRVHGKGNKTRYIPLHAGTQELLNDYLDEARHAADTAPPPDPAPPGDTQPASRGRPAV